MKQLEAQMTQNTEDISKVTAAVAELTVTMKYEMERSKEERENFKILAVELRGLSDKMTALALINTELAEVKKDVAVLQANEKMCKEWRDKHDGATGAMKLAIKAMWTVCGAGVMSVLGFVLYLYFTNATPTVIRKIGGNEYMGQVISNE